MKNRAIALLIVCVAAPLACRSAGYTDQHVSRPPPLFDGLGNHHRAVTTPSAQAQRYFDQGLVWAFAFNHDEAIRSFTEAARHDPNCAMAWWGVALCNGPHINNPAMDEAHSKAAWHALQQAIALKDRVSPAERSLIDALSKRYADPTPADRGPLDQAYAAAMREVWKANRGDADIGVLFAESMMDLRPWDLWTKDGKPQPGTDEIVAVLDEVQKLNPDHPGALHLYIHANEASPNPGKATAASDRLRNLVPASGHLVHMPSHIDVLTGRWAVGAESNVKAIEADRAYRAISPRQDFYRIYMAHNHHMLAFISMMEGRSEAALQASREMIAGVPAEFIREKGALVDGAMAIELEVLMRFGRWDEILRQPAPSSHLPISRTIWRFARGVAYAAKGEVDKAEKEKAAFLAARSNVPPDAVLSINSAKDVLAIAEHMLNGEIAFRRGSIDEAVAELRKAIAIEDQLKYMEPPEWVQPVRHTLGAILLHAGRTAEAEEVYREDLKHWPENGWSLYGLAECLKKRGATAEADEFERRFKKAWARADVKIGSSCLCVARG